MLVSLARPLKYTAYTALACILLYTGGYAALYRVSEHAPLQQAAQNLLAPYGRTIAFDADIERRLLPRPTIIIKNAALSEAGNRDTAFQAAEIRIGIAWSSMFGPKNIEKLVIHQAKGSLKRLPDGNWNGADLLQMRHNPNNGALNRLQIENSNLLLEDNGQILQLDNIDAFAYAENGGHRYQIAAQVRHPYWQQLELAINGHAISDQNGLKFPNAVAEFSGSENGYRFSGSLKADAQWRPQHFQTNNIRLQAQSGRHQTALSGTAAQIVSQNGRAAISALNIVADARENQTAYNTTVSTSDAVWQNGRFDSGDLRVNINIHNNNQTAPLALHANGRAQWHAQQGFSLNPIKITTLKNSTTHNHTSEWEGSLNVHTANAWHLAAKGLYERQPAQLQLQKQQNHLSGSLNLAKLDLSRQSLQTDALPAYPKLPEQLTFNLQLDIGTLGLPELEIHNINTVIHADKNTIRLNPLSAELYSGSSSGSLTIENTIPPTLHLQQQADKVQLRPLLEHLIGNSRVAGIGQARFDLRAQGSNRKELIRSLNGRIQFDVKDGEWLGINFNHLIKNIFGFQIPLENDSPNSPFSHFSYTSDITDGISSHTVEAELTEPKVHISSKGTGNFNTNTLDTRMLITGYGNEAPLPLRLQGSFSTPDISLDYQKMTSGLATPEQKQKALTETLKKQWDWLKTR